MSERTSPAVHERVLQEHNGELLKAWDALAKYKFWMFGYHAAKVVTFRQILGLKGNPFRLLVQTAQRYTAEHTVGQILAEAHQQEPEGGKR